MNFAQPPAPSTDPIMAMVRGELTSRKRWFYRLVLLVAGIGLALLLSLWLTEPRPLPPRLDVAFAVLTAIASGWIAVLTWILTRRACPTAVDRIATAWMATAGTTLSLVVSVPIALLRGNVAAASGLALLGVILVGLSLTLLRRAYRVRSELRQRLFDMQAAGRADRTDG